MGLVTNAVNAIASIVIDYAPDPHQPGTGLADDAINRIQYMAPFVGGGNCDPGGQWWGADAWSPQAFRGLGALDVVAGQDDIIRNGAFPQVSDAIVSNSLGDPNRRAFLARLRAGGSL